jgi:putative ABC transport system permease protein
VFTGSDVAVPVSDASAEGLPFPATVVTRLDGGRLVPGGLDVDLLAVDPATFSGAAFWDSSFAGRPLDDLVRALGRRDGPLPVVVTRPSSASTLELSATRMRIEVVEVARAFPGVGAGRPLVVVDRAALEEAFEAAGGQALPSGRDELWAKGEASATLAALTRAGFDVSEAITPERVRRGPAFLALFWTFGFLQALGVMAGLIALVGIVLYLQSRQRTGIVSYALTRRMGLRAAAHRLSVGLELVAMLLIALVLGGGFAVLAARLVYLRLDLLPDLPPPPLFRLPIALLLATAAGAVVASSLGAWRVGRSAERANVAEVIRSAG